MTAMLEVVEYETEEKVELFFSNPGSFDGSMVKLEHVAFGYSPDKILLNNIDLLLLDGMDVAIPHSSSWYWEPLIP